MCTASVTALGSYYKVNVTGESSSAVALGTAAAVAAAAGALVSVMWDKNHK